MFCTDSEQFSDFRVGISDSTPGHNITNTSLRARQCPSALVCPSQLELEEINSVILQYDNLVSLQNPEAG